METNEQIASRIDQFPNGSLLRRAVIAELDARSKTITDLEAKLICPATHEKCAEFEKEIYSLKAKLKEALINVVSLNREAFKILHEEEIESLQSRLSEKEEEVKRLIMDLR